MMIESSDTIAEYKNCIINYIYFIIKYFLKENKNQK